MLDCIVLLLFLGPDKRLGLPSNREVRKGNYVVQAAQSVVLYWERVI